MRALAVQGNRTPSHRSAGQWHSKSGCRHRRVLILKSFRENLFCYKWTTHCWQNHSFLPWEMLAAHTTIREDVCYDWCQEHSPDENIKLLQSFRIWTMIHQSVKTLHQNYSLFEPLWGIAGVSAFPLVNSATPSLLYSINCKKLVRISESFTKTSTKDNRMWPNVSPT